MFRQFIISIYLDVHLGIYLGRHLAVHLVIYLGQHLAVHLVYTWVDIRRSNHLVTRVKLQVSSQEPLLQVLIRAFIIRQECNTFLQHAWS